jgi:hypothetical protein
MTRRKVIFGELLSVHVKLEQLVSAVYFPVEATTDALAWTI